MFMKFNNKYETIFLDKDSKGFDSSLSSAQKVNIVLSPSLYWVKKLHLPVKYLRDVKKLLPSIFEDTLPEGNYSYSAYKKGDEFIVVAYEDKAILELMAHKGLQISNVANVYLAQSVLEGMEGAFRVSETQSVYVKEGIVLLVPSGWIKESGELDISALKLPEHKIQLQQYGHILNTKSFYTLGVVLIAFIVLLSGEYFITSQKTQTIIDAKEELFAKNGLKATTMQNKALLKEYTKIHTLQSKLRESIAAVLSLRLPKEQKISFINLKNKKLIVNFSGLKQGNEKKILTELKNKGLHLKEKFKEGVLHVEITL